MTDKKITSPAGEKPKKSRLTLYIVAAIVSAITVALFFPHFAVSLDFGGEIFLRMLKMLVVPLVVVSVMNGILGMGDIRKLGRPGAYTVLYYITTTVLAVFVGLIVVNIIKPGVGYGDTPPPEVQDSRTKILESLSLDTGLNNAEIVKVFPELKEVAEGDQATIGTIFKNLLLMLVTDNLFQAAAESNLLPLIVFSIIFAAMLTTMGKRVRTITEIIDQANTAMMSFILLLMKIAPIGIFCLVAARFGEAQAKGEFVDQMRQTGWYMGTVLCGLAVHALGTLPLVYWMFTKKNPFRFLYRMAQALLMAFSTASSSATLPVTMECANIRGGVSKRSTEFVLPLGATINMDGTALYEAAAAIFIAQVVGIELGIGKQLIIAVTATLAAIGAAGIPEAGLVTMIIVLNAVGLPVEYMGLILSVDWLLDRFRTAVNVFGDSVGAAVVANTFGAETIPNPPAAGK